MVEGLPLSCVPIGTKGVISHISGGLNNKERLMELGFTKDAEVIPLHKSPAGDPVAYCIKGVIMALRKEDADKIFIRLREEG